MSEPGLHNVFDLLLEGDESSWVHLLLYVAVFGLITVGRIVFQRKESRKSKTGGGQRPRPARRSPEPTPSRGLAPNSQAPAEQPLSRDREFDRPEAPAAGRPRPRTLIRPGSALGAFVAEIKKEIKNAAEQAQGIKTPPAAALRLEQLPTPAPPVPTTPQVEPSEPLRDTIPFGAEIMEDAPINQPELAGPEDLKKAVLYYEILGKPVSMRGQSEHLMGL